tara:strand:- start:538 stop:1758 length:1221 start_codon:yes stop_codon:yes gene_type:complete
MSVRVTGKPLIAVMALLSSWVALRVTTWEPPFPLPSRDTLFAQSTTGASATAHRVMARSKGPARFAGKAFLPLKETRLPGMAAQRFDRGTIPIPAMAQKRLAGLSPFTRLQNAASHQKLFAAALAFIPSYETLASASFGQAVNASPGRVGRADRALALGRQPGRAIAGPLSVQSASQPVVRPQRPDRWSADAWLLVRDGKSAERLASVNPASYGSDQVGAVVRYALAPGSAVQPALYARASKALVRDGEAEVAGGVSVGLARSFPLRVHGELRVTDRPGAIANRTQVRPAAFVVTGLPRQEIVPGLEADSYLQAGYVGGDFETGFVDGKASVEAPLLRSDTGRLAVGAGVWGGAQRDASRLDVGPTASTILSTGKANLRASIDYRFRVGGDASPGDGPALTIAASF